MAGLIEARIDARHEWNPELVTLTLDLSANFEPGQFFNLGLRVQDSSEVMRRSYSAASAPGAALEFVVSLVDEGKFTPQLFDQQVGQSVLIDPTPLGFFTLKEVPEVSRLWLVGTGTGLGPYISMLRSTQLTERFEKVVVVHGVRHSMDLSYADELRDAARKDARLLYVPALSGDETDPPADALAGRITTVFDSGALEEGAGSFDEQSHMLLCGNPQMIDDMVERLKSRGFEKHRRRKPGHFNFERYW